MRDLIRMTSSDSRETLKVTFTLVLLTVMSLDWSGMAEANVHSSSSLEAVVLLIGYEGVDDCPRFEELPRLSSALEDGGGAAGLTDCWNWKGDACRGAGEESATNGSANERNGC